MKKAICILIVLTMMVGFLPTSFADNSALEIHPSDGIESSNPYCSDTFYCNNIGIKASSFTLSPSLSISSPTANKITVVAQAHTSIIVDKLGFSSLHIQRWNGSSWVNVVSWYNQYKYNTSTFSKIGSTSTATSGAYYRAVCTFYAEKDGETESVTVTTSYIKCK